MECLADIDVRARLKHICVPTLVIHSRGDQKVALARGKELAAEMPGAKLLTLDTENHFPMPREPAFRVMMSEIEAFLAN